MPQQLSQIPLRRRRYPDPRKPVLQQQIENMQSISRVGLLPPHHGGANLGRISYPKLVSQLGQHPLEPLRVASCFHAHPHWLLQPGVKLLCLTVRMFQLAFDQVAGFCVHHRNLLEARMKICAYNQHTRLLSSESWSDCTAKFTPVSEEPTLLSNHAPISLARRVVARSRLLLPDH